MHLGRNKNANYLFQKELKRNRYIGIACGLICLALVIVVFFAAHFSYSRSANKYFEQQSNETMTEVSYQISKVVSNKIEYWYDQLDLTAELFAEKSGGYKNDQMMQMYQEDLQRMNTSLFYEMGVLLDDGTLVLSGGETHELGGEAYIDYLLDARVGRLAGTVETDGLADKLLLAVPVGESTEEDGEAADEPDEEAAAAPDGEVPDAPDGEAPAEPDGGTVDAADATPEDEELDTAVTKPVAIIGLVEATDIEALLETEIFGENMSYVVISDEEGNLVIQTEAKKQFGENLLDTFSTFADPEVVNDLREALEAGESATIELMGVTTQFMTYYTPAVLGEGDTGDYSIYNWRLLVLTRMDILTENISNLFFESKMILYSVLTVVIGLLEIVVILLVKKRNQKLQLSCLDPMTGLINDGRFEHDGTKLIWKKENAYAVVSYNIMRFKLLNDRIGRNQADEVLRIIARTIGDFIRHDELVAHSFADRFSVLMRMDTDEGEERIQLLEKKLLEAHYPGDSKLEFTIGVYRLEEGVNICDAMDRARLAQTMTREQHREISNLVTFTPQMLEQEREQGALADMAEGALKERNFLVYYQLKRNIQNDGWAGCEALVRWKDPDMGFIYPSKFIPLFEKNGFVVKLDKYVFETVCMDLREMLDKGENVVPVSINLSQCHFEEEDFFDEYEEIMNQYDIPHDLLEFEVTESMAAGQPDAVKALIDRLHGIGCRCSMDDFGTGYSSLHSVQEFAFDTIKLDRSFFYGSTGFNHDSQLIVETLISLSHKLGKTVVSEGIEEEDQVEFLREKDCDIVQGYFYAKPAPVCECRKRLTP